MIFLLFSKMIGIDEIIHTIFGSDIETVNILQSNEENLSSTRISHALNIVNEHIEKVLIDDSNVEALGDNRQGRIGPETVTFDTSAHYGLFIVSPDRLGLNSQRNFSTIRANTGVFKGKWMYELQLGSKGVMQVGWSTMQCKFNDEFGVGDTVNSYAYDGNRVKKWNISTYKYGEAWLSGDIIGCALDADEGTIDFYRNGRCLGRAFENICLGNGIAYFPTVSLAFTENLRANFGVIPLRYPIQDYSPLQVAPKYKLRKATLLIGWLSSLVHQLHNIRSTENTILLSDETSMTAQTFMMCLARVFARNIGPLLKIAYIVEALFLPFLEQHLNSPTSTESSGKTDNSTFMICLDLLWTFLEDHEIELCLEATVMHLLSAFRHISMILEYPDQCKSLILLTNLCKHTATRQHLLQNVLFNTVKFANFVHVKPLDENGLAEVVSKVWWETNPVDPTVEANKKHYMAACEKITSSTSEVEALQVELLVTLLDNTDGTERLPSSRTIFLRKFRRFVHETLISSQTSPMLQTPLPITLCCFHRLLVTFRVLWDNEIGTNPVYIPCRVFYDNSINYSGIDRLGGVLPHLQKTYKTDLIRLLGQDHEVLKSLEQSQDTNLNMGGSSRLADTSIIVPTLARMINFNQGGSVRPIFLERLGYLTYNREDKTLLRTGPADPTHSLIELLDGIILFYYATAKKQIAKIASLREIMSEYITTMADTKSRLEQVKKQNGPESESLQKELTQSISVFEAKLTELSRHMAWVRAFVYSKQKQAQLAWLLKAVTSTLRSASEEGNIFAFVPDVYLEALADLTAGIRSHIHPTLPIDEIPGYEDMLRDIAHFLCDHFMDPRIVLANAKDTLTLTLAAFVANPITLKALESVPFESSMKMVSNLLRPYENRAWAQLNFILVRFWQGKGFAFRYEESPHLAKKIGPKMLHQEISQPFKPCPSSKFQMYVKMTLLNNPQTATRFLDSLLNQLNWTFSEFIGMVQEIHNVSSRPERVFIESRQLKVCATCFNLTVSLLRVFEMIVTIAPSIFSDPALSSGNLLGRLCQLLCQILNRMSSHTSCFQHVVMLNIPDLDTVDHFPILAAVIGILIALLRNEMTTNYVAKKFEDDEIPIVTKTLLMEPSFQISSLQYVLNDITASNLKTKNVKPFSFHNYKEDVSENEILRVEVMIEYLDENRALLPETSMLSDDENTCTICYAYPIAVTFKPCNHQSCQACIDRYLLISHECFFCKATIDKVVNLEGVSLHDFSNNNANQNTIS